MKSGALVPRLLALASLMLAGEAIFCLPFHVARFFRPTLLEVYGLSNAALGDAFAVYGLTAMLCYFPGGMVADRWSARSLMTLALLLTAVGGIYLASVPGPPGLAMLYGYWGVTTILPFWAAMIRATREWGGELAQGRAFGLLDAGRGLAAAALASVAVALLGQGLAPGAETLSAEARAEHLRTVIYFYTAVTVFAAVCSWYLIPSRPAAHSPGRTLLRSSWREALRLPLVWRQAGIVVAAYCGYKGIDNYSLYAVQILGMNEIDAARLVANAAYLRPLAAMAAGLLADRYRASTALAACFTLAAASYGLLGLASGALAQSGVLLANLLVSVGAVYGLRGVYFAALEEARVPHARTGTAVGIISVVGYTPDIFFAPIAGRLLDSAPGMAGHQHYFLLLALTALAGLALSLSLLVEVRQRHSSASG